MTVQDEHRGDHQQSSGTNDEGWGPTAPLHVHEAANLETLDRVAACWNAHDVAGILAHYQDDIVWHDVAADRTYAGTFAVGAFLHELFRAIPDLTLTITRRIPRGDLVAEEYTIAGTHLGSLFGVPPTGRALRLSAVSYVEMREAKFARDQFYFDIATLLGQMGLFPPLAVAERPVGHAVMRALVFLRSPRRAIAVARRTRRTTGRGRLH